VEFIRGHSLAVEATIGPAGMPQAAVVGYVATEDLSLFFDTLESTRKAVNLRENRRVAFVIGDLAPGAERTLQYEGTADEPGGLELARLKALYFVSFPAGREREQWPGIAYFRVRPTWLRYSDYGSTPPRIVEFNCRDGGNPI